MKDVFPKVLLYFNRHELGTVFKSVLSGWFGVYKNDKISYGINHCHRAPLAMN
jgi:hypothetical protein